MGRGRFLRDERYPKTIWAIYDSKEDKLLVRYKSKSNNDSSYTRVYKSVAAAENYVNNFLKDTSRYKIYEYNLESKIKG